MRPLVACDLDRTLIYSAKAFWLETPDDEAPPIVVCEVYNGAPISFMTRRSEDLLTSLALAATFMPVTTRTVTQYRRVQLAGGTPPFAVTSNGGVILVNGVPDALWGANVRSRLHTEAAPLPDVAALLEDPTATAWIVRTTIAEDLFVYSIVDRDAMPPEWLASLDRACRSLGWTVSLQGRKLYCVPNPLTKSEAVAEVARRLGGPLVLAAGDSLLDQPMLERADAAFRPAHGELHDVGFTHATLTVTRQRGILAGEELLGLLTRYVAEGHRH